MSCFYKKFLLVAMSVLMIGCLIGCSSNNDNSKKEDLTKVENDSSNESGEIKVKEIPADLLKDFKLNFKDCDNKSLGNFRYDAMRNLDSLALNDILFTYDDNTNLEYNKGEFVFFRGENAKKFIVEHFGEYGYDSKYVDDYISELSMQIGDFCFFLFRTDSVYKDSREILEDGTFKDAYMMGFITENDHSLNMYNMVTHDMYSYMCTASK